MKKKILYIAAVIVCLCMFTTASKECGKVINDKCAEASYEKISTAEKKSTEQEENKPELSLIHMLLLETI